LGSLCGFKPFFLSFWGSDIFSFPRKGFLNKAIILYNLRKADKIFSSSQVMAKEILNYTRKQVLVIPFGIDIDQFKNLEASLGDETVIGIAKALEKEYGIEFLIKAFKFLKEWHPHVKMKLIIAGEGSKRKELENLVQSLNLSAFIFFAGHVPHAAMPAFYNKITIAVFPSLQESFGVSAIEASACERPVVVSDVGGLPEVIENGVSGLVVPAKDINALAEAIAYLIENKEVAKEIGRRGRMRVMTYYNWDDNVNQMAEIYQNTFSKS
jgi:glycosyltransferase involved in cell wall biosynthesis